MGSSPNAPVKLRREGVAVQTKYAEFTGTAEVVGDEIVIRLPFGEHEAAVEGLEQLKSEEDSE